MLQAWIVSRRESLYFAAAASPCSLVALQRHVRKMQRHRHGALHLRLSLGGSNVGIGAAGVSAFLQRLASEGIRATLADAKESSGTLRSPDAGSRAARLAAARSDDDGDRPSASPTTSVPPASPSISAPPSVSEP